MCAVNLTQLEDRGLTRGEVDELRRSARCMIDDEIGDELDAIARAWTSAHVPRRIGLRVIARIEAGIGAVDRVEEREELDAAEQAGKAGALTRWST
jgi:hypothetical protein